MSTNPKVNQHVFRDLRIALVGDSIALRVEKDNAILFNKTDFLAQLCAGNLFCIGLSYDEKQRPHAIFEDFDGSPQSLAHVVRGAGFNLEPAYRNGNTLDYSAGNLVMCGVR